MPLADNAVLGKDLGSTRRRGDTENTGPKRTSMVEEAAPSLSFLRASAPQRQEKVHEIRASFTTAAIRKIASRLRSTSASVVAQEETLMRMAERPCHTVPPHQQVPSS